METENDLTEAAQQLVINHALRFDGYAWAKAQGAPDGGGPAYLGKRLYEPFRQSGRIPIDPATALALNFCLHRNFYHSGQLPGPGNREWVEMVLLYLHTYRLPTPPVFRHRLADEWDQRPKGSAEALAAEMRQLLARRLGVA